MIKKWLCGVLAVILLATAIPGYALRIYATEAMTCSDEMIDVLKKMEGFAPRAYWDYSQYTVGYGTRCPDDMLEEYDAETGRDITEEEAIALLKDMLASFEKTVNNFITKYGLTLEQHQFDALVSFTYNCGGAWTRDTDGYFNTAVRSGDMGNALIYGMCLHSKAGGSYILIKRRLSEANMYLNGEYKAYNADKNPYPSNYKYVYLDGNGGTVRYAIHGYDASQPPAVVTSFSDIPTGVDENGNAFVYEFAGWYTATTGGELVETLDGSLANGTVLYAQWKDPSGQIVALPKGDVVDNLVVTITSSVSVRSGAGTFHSKIGSLSEGDQVTITETYTLDGTTWGKFEDGWFSLSYSNYEDVLASLIPDSQWPQEGTVTGDNVNVRSGPGTSNAVMYQLNSGDRVSVYEIDDSGSLVWGKLEDGNWICMSYVSLDATEEESEPDLTGVTLLAAPVRKEYVQMQDLLDLSGGILQLSYSDGSIGALSVTASMITNYSNADLGETTVEGSYGGFDFSFTVTIVMATVTFCNYDCTVLSSDRYAYGDTVVQPEPPEKPGDEAGEYVFVGWDPEVTACAGDATYTAVFALYVPMYTVTFCDYDGTVISTGEYELGAAVTEPEAPTRPADENGEYVFAGWDKEITACEGDTTYTAVYTLIPAEPEYILGDFNGDEIVDEDDAIYLLRYVFFPEDYPVDTPSDFNADGVTDEDDAIYLLRYVFFPEDYPLTNYGT